MRVSKRDGEILELISKSKIDVNYNQRHFLINDAVIRLTGPIAKLPSSSNNRMVMLHKKKLESLIRSRQSSAALGELARMRPVNTLNPAYATHLDALTRMWEHHSVKFHFNISAKSRGFMVLACSSLLNRCDSHNILKSASDWLQAVGIINNDKFLDACAVRTEDYLPLPEATYIVLRRAGDCRNGIYSLMSNLNVREANDNTPKQTAFI